MSVREEDQERSADLLRTITQHDAEISNLTGRVASVESVIKVMSHDMNRGFAEIGNKLAEIKGAKGPGLGQVIGVVAAGCAVVGMCAGAITILVTSFVSPDITKLRTEAVRTERALDLREQQERQELTDLRKAQAQNHADDIRAIGKALRVIESRIDARQWAGGTEIVKPK